MHSRRKFLRRSAAAVGALAVRLALPAAAVVGRCLPNVLRYAHRPFMRINLLRHIVR